jgi:hypothetical protein
MNAHRPTLWTTLLTSALMIAASPTPRSAQERADVQVAVGLGYSFPTKGELAGGGLGGSLLVNYAFAPMNWGGGRAYAGGIVTSPDAESCSTGVDPCAVSSQIAVFGAKVRLLVPIPYVGPFLEVGAGASVGAIETRLGPFGTFRPVDEDHAGVMFHIPVSVGLAFGARHQHEASFVYFAHPGRNHVAGALQLGVGFSWP